MATNARRKSGAISAAPGVPAQEPSGVSDIDRILSGDFGTGGGDTQAVGLKTRDTVANTRHRQEAGQLADQVISIETMTEDEKLKARAQILQAQIEQMRQALPDDKKALGVLVSTLNTSFQELREGFAKVAEYNTDEQRVIKRAELAHVAATGELAKANEDLEKAKTRTTWFGFRERAVASAESAIAVAEEAVGTAKLGVDTATATAQKMRDERLQGADFEGSFAFIEACVKQTKIAISERIKHLEAQSTEAEAKRVQSFDRKQTAAVNMEKQQIKVEELQARFQQESEARDQLPAGSSERVAADAKVSAIQHEFEEARAHHDQQLAVYQEMEKAVKALEIQETALRVGLHAHKVELARLVAGSDVWVVEARNRIAQIKSLASQQASKDLIEVNVAVRKDNVRNSAAFAIASLELVTAQAERHPAEMADLGVYGDSMGEGLQQIADRWKAVADKIKAAENGTPTPQGQ